MRPFEECHLKDSHGSQLQYDIFILILKKGGAGDVQDFR